MLWVGLFILGVFGVLAGLIPLILKGPRVGNAATLVAGILLIGAGAAGVVAKPEMLALRLPRIVIGGDDASAPPAAPVAKTTDSFPAADAPQAAATPSPAIAAESAKDESQMAPAALPEPVPVTTTRVVGVEAEPMANEPQTQNDAAETEPVPLPVAAPPPDNSAALAALASQQARDENAFTKVVTAAREEYQAASFEDRDALQSSRAAAICAAVKSTEVKNWVGQIKEIEKDAGGRTIVTVALPNGTLVKTWNNAMSDVEDKTLILAGTPLAATFGKLSAGDAVRFSGTFFADEPDCFRSSRLSLDQSMTEPSFLFRFTEVEKL